MDKVFIKGLEVEGIIGIFQWEREVKQVISVDIEMEFDNKKAAKSDSIEDALNYKKVGKRVTAFIQKSKFQLVESLAENIAKIILKEFHKIFLINMIKIIIAIYSIIYINIFKLVGPIYVFIITSHHNFKICEIIF